MAASKRNVERLVAAAWRGMLDELNVEEGSAEDVINASINIARTGIRYACSAASGNSPEQLEHNRRVIGDTLKMLLMDTVDDLKVF